MFITLSKRHLACILAAVTVVLIAAGWFASLGGGSIDGSTNAARTKYLEGLGYIAEQSGITSKNIIIPKEFGEVYDEYNKLQKKAGFNLSHHKGEEATVFTYRLSGENGKEAHLIVEDGCIIGGDIASIKLDGEMIPLIKR